MSMSNWIGLNIVILKSSAETMLVHLTFSYSLIEPIWFTGSIGSLDNWTYLIVITLVVIFIVIFVIIGIIVIIVTVDISLVLLFIGSLGHWFIGCATWLWTCGCVFNSMLPALDFPYRSYHHCLKMMQQLFFESVPLMKKSHSRLCCGEFGFRVGGHSEWPSLLSLSPLGHGRPSAGMA